MLRGARQFAAHIRDPLARRHQHFTAGCLGSLHHQQAVAARRLDYPGNVWGGLLKQKVDAHRRVGERAVPEDTHGCTIKQRTLKRLLAGIDAKHDGVILPPHPCDHHTVEERYEPYQAVGFLIGGGMYS